MATMTLANGANWRPGLNRAAHSWDSAQGAAADAQDAGVVLPAAHGTAARRPSSDAQTAPPSPIREHFRTLSGGSTGSAPTSPLKSAGSLTLLEKPPLLRRPSLVHGYTTACTNLAALEAWAAENQPPPAAAAAGADPLAEGLRTDSVAS